MEMRIPVLLAIMHVNERVRALDGAFASLLQPAVASDNDAVFLFPRSRSTSNNYDDQSGIHFVRFGVAAADGVVPVCVCTCVASER